MRHPEMHSLCRSYSLGEFPMEGQVFFINPKSVDFHEILTFLRNCQGAFWKLLRCIRSFFACVRVRRNDLDNQKRNLWRLDISRFFMPLIAFRDTFVRIIVFVLWYHVIRNIAGRLRESSWAGVLRVITRGRHGWRFTARIKCGYDCGSVENNSKRSHGRKSWQHSFQRYG